MLRAGRKSGVSGLGNCSMMMHGLFFLFALYGVGWAQRVYFLGIRADASGNLNPIFFLSKFHFSSIFLKWKSCA